MSDSDHPGADRTMPDTITIKDVYREVSKLSGSIIRFEAQVTALEKESSKAQTSADDALKQITEVQIQFASFKAQWGIITALIATAVPVILTIIIKVLKLT